jgi:hypothetical protein
VLLVIVVLHAHKGCVLLESEHQACCRGPLFLVSSG